MKVLKAFAVGMEIYILFLLLIIGCNHLQSCVTVPKGHYTLKSKKEIQTFNPSSPRATMLIFHNDSTGKTVLKRVFIDTFTLGECYYFMKRK